MFNDPKCRFDVISTFKTEEYPALAIVIDQLNPNSFHQRPGRTLYDHFIALRRRYNTIFQNWDQSGRHDGASFHNFCPGDTVIQYTHLLWANSQDSGGSSNYFEMALTQKIPQAWNFSANPNECSETSDFSNHSFSDRKRKTRIDSVDKEIVGLLQDFRKDPKRMKSTFSSPPSSSRTPSSSFSLTPSSSPSSCSLSPFSLSSSLSSTPSSVAQTGTHGNELIQLSSWIVQAAKDLNNLPEGEEFQEARESIRRILKQLTDKNHS